LSLSVAIQMDPIHSIDIDGDSTFALALEAQARGHSLFYYLPKNLSLRDGVVVARGHDLTVQRIYGDHATLGPERQVELASMDVVLLRQDPPFDMGYITSTHLLERVHPDTLVVNDPGHVRNAPEKILVTEFPELMPETLITANKDEIIAFREEYKDIILKPLYGNGGAGVFRLREGDENLNSLFEMFEEFYREPIIAQRYLPEVRQGDKRVILVDGKPAGVINRVPAEGETRSNMHVGGVAEKSVLSARDQEICDTIGPMLKERGLIFVGIDIIGDYLTEINVTSPTGIQEIDRYDGINLSALVWDAIEAKR
jgi:glutathione synthase